MQPNEIYLIDMGRIVAREWRSFALVSLCVLGLAVAYALLAKPRWEATAWVQVGQIGTAPAGQDPRPEPFQRVVDRLQTVVFQNQVLERIGVAEESQQGDLYRKSLKVDPSPYAGLIKLSVRGASPDQAHLLAQATVAELQDIHQHIQQTPMTQARVHLDEMQVDLQTALKERDGLKKTTDAIVEESRHGGQSAAVAGQLLAAKEAEIRDLRRARSDLSARLGENYTFATSMPWPIYQPDKPVSPNRVLIIGLGILAGVGLGLFVAVARDAKRFATQPRGA